MTSAGPVAPLPGSLDAARLPGTGARLRAVQPLMQPGDVPAWMTRGGAAPRAAAAAMAADAVAVRRAGESLRAVLGDVSTALRWHGTAADSARNRAQALRDQLAGVASRFDAARAALDGLAAALDAQHAALGSAAARWAGAQDPAGQLALLRQWQPAVRAVDAADGRAADALRGVASALGTVHIALGPAGTATGLPAASGGRHRGLLDTALDAVGSFCAEAVNAAASFANAMGQHPAETAQLMAGLLLTGVGAGGEVVGGALDATGVGVLAGAPVNALSGAAVAAGAGLTGRAVGQLAQQAAGEDRVEPLRMGGDRPSGGSQSAGEPVQAGEVDIEHAVYAQRTVGRKFSLQGAFKGRPVDEVVADLKAGKMTAQDVPIDVIVRRGRTFILNTRSSAALESAGIPRSQWRTVNRTGQSGYEARLSDQLRRNNLGSDGTTTVRARGR